MPNYFEKDKLSLGPFRLKPLLSFSKKNFLVLSSVLLWFFLAFSPNNKIFIAGFLIYLTALSLYLRQVKIALIYTYLVSLPFGRIGKTYEISLVTPAEMKIVGLNGLSAQIIISIQWVLALFIVFFLARDFISRKRKKLSFDPLALLFFVYFACRVIACIFGSIRPEISLMLSINEIIFFLFYLFYFSNKNNQINSDLKKLIVVNLAAISAVAIFQFLRRSPLGLAFEQDTSLSLSVTGSDDDPFVYRANSVFPHPNDLASYLLPFLAPLSVTFLTNFRKKTGEYLTYIVIILGFLASGTRAAIILAPVSVLLLYFFLRYFRITVFLPRLSRRFKLVILFLLILFGINLFPRFLKIGDTLTDYGGISTRLALINSTKDIFSLRPFFGIGPGMTTYFKYKYYQPKSYQVAEVMSYFPSPVHNGFLFLLEESGLFGLIPYLFILWFILRSLITRAKNTTSDKTKALSLGIFCGIVISILNSMVHVQSLSLDQLLTLLIIGNIV